LTLSIIRTTRRVPAGTCTVFCLAAGAAAGAALGAASARLPAGDVAADASAELPAGAPAWLEVPLQAAAISPHIAIVSSNERRDLWFFIMGYLLALAFAGTEREVMRNMKRPNAL